MNFLQNGEKSANFNEMIKSMTFPMETGIPEIDRLVQPRDVCV